MLSGDMHVLNETIPLEEDEMLISTNYDQILYLIQEGIIICYSETFIIILIYMLVKFEFYYVHTLVFFTKFTCTIVRFCRSHIHNGFPKK